MPDQPLRQVRLGKLHLIVSQGERTMCGVPVSVDHITNPVVRPWVGWDKCRRCRHATREGKA